MQAVFRILRVFGNRQGKLFGGLVPLLAASCFIPALKCLFTVAGARAAIGESIENTSRQVSDKRTYIDLFIMIRFRLNVVSKACLRKFTRCGAYKVSKTFVLRRSKTEPLRFSALAR